MKHPGILLAGLIMAAGGCTVDRTVETLLPRNALAVVVIDQPLSLVQSWGPEMGDFPWQGLPVDRPWAAAVIPAQPPGILLAIPVDSRTEVWSRIIEWTKAAGGLDTVQLGTYGLVFSTGMAAPAVLDPDQRFDLSRVRRFGEPWSAYLDVENLLLAGTLPAMSLPDTALRTWFVQNLAGLRFGTSIRNGQWEAKLTTDWRPRVPVSGFLVSLGRSAELASWTGGHQGGLFAAAHLSRPLLAAMGRFIPDPTVAARWDDLVPSLGPRFAVSAVPRADGTWAWAAAVESRDPQAVRQALKTLVAGGELQRVFPRWSIDPDTPLIYQDRPDGWGGVQTQIVLGAETMYLTYGADRVALAGGAGAVDRLRSWQRPGLKAAPWFGEVPSGASLVASGLVDGLAARAAVQILGDGNLELRVWMTPAELKIWAERLPQAALGWLSGEAGWTRWEP